MSRRTLTLGLRIGLLGVAVGVTTLLGSAPMANAETRDGPVTRWVTHNASALDTVDPTGPLSDLRPLRRSVDDAFVVGLGESAHGAAEETQLKHRVLRLLVERMGFRTVAWEEDWTTGLLIDRYIRTGEGDLGELMGRMSDQYQTREVADVLRWLRGYNAEHADKVRFVGVEYYYTQPSAYDAVAAYVAETAPHRLPELEEHLDAIRPDTSDMKAYVEEYQGLPAESKERNARRGLEVHRLVESLQHGNGDRAYAVALHHARQIRSFYEYYALEMNEANQHREAHAAANLRWWRDYSGRDEIAYWAASAHAANAPDLHIALPPPAPDLRFASAGSYLRRWYGDRYLSIGFTFDHGAVYLGDGQTAEQPKPKPEWFEKPFGDVEADQFTLDLEGPAPSPVQDWLEGPVKTRGLAHAGADSYIDGGSLEQWFDVIVHRQTVSPAHAP
jgi:erythromycin esterase-like protein